MDSESTAPEGAVGRGILFALVPVVILAGATMLGYLLYTSIREYVAHAQVSFLPSEPVVTHVQKGRAKEEDLPDLTKHERATILLLGIDQRGDDPGPWRTDTLIVVTIDPATNTAGMLSIPRDLWVTVPGYGEHKINTAHFIGDAEGYPGGGPALAKKTVRNLLGVPIDYYVRVNFTGFESLIDAIGGITIDVESPIDDYEYPDGNYGTMEVHIPAGVQHMDGETALQYARSRHGTSDYDRSRRQQMLLMAIRDKALGLDISIDRIPEILRIVGDSVQTDLNLVELTALAQAGREINLESITNVAIDEATTRAAITPAGMWVAIPDRDAIRELRDQIFPAPSPTAIVSQAPDESKLEAESAYVQILNGTLEAGLAQRTSARLRQDGFKVAGFGNADRADYAQTVIIDLTGNPYTTQALASAFGVPPANVISRSEANPEADIRLILGQDYASVEPQS
jgi:LCP family protein required for cell wall assembly